MIANRSSACQTIVVLVDPDARKVPQTVILRGGPSLTEVRSAIYWIPRIAGEHLRASKDH